MGMLPNVFVCVLQCSSLCLSLGNLISLFYILQDVKVWKFLFRFVPLIINTSVDNYTLRNGIRYQQISIQDKIQKK